MMTLELVARILIFFFGTGAMSGISCQLARGVAVRKILLVKGKRREYSQRCPGNRRLRPAHVGDLSRRGGFNGAGGARVTEVDLSMLMWRKSSACFESNCVEVAAVKGLVMVRDTRDSGSIILTFSSRGWAIFLRRMQDNDPID